MWVKYLRKERRKLPPTGNQFDGIRKKEKKKKNKRKVAWRRKKRILFFLFFFVSLLDLRKLDRRISSDQKAKCSTQRGQRVDSGFEEFRQTL